MEHYHEEASGAGGGGRDKAKPTGFLLQAGQVIRCQGAELGAEGSQIRSRGDSGQTNLA